MKIEGSITLEQSRLRRVVSAIALFAPVFVTVLGVAWFIRVYVAPPVVAIPGPMTLASVPTNGRAAEPERDSDPQPAEVTASQYEPYGQAAAIPMIATLSVAPFDWGTLNAEATSSRAGVQVTTLGNSGDRHTPPHQPSLAVSSAGDFVPVPLPRRRPPL